MSAEAVAIQKLAQRLAVEIANKELAEAHLAVQKAEIAALRERVEAIGQTRETAKRRTKKRPA